MRAAELEHYLHTHLPLSRAMAVRVLSVAPEALELQAPLAPNINHHETVFGGSASALAILAAWSLLHVRLRAAGIRARLVIQRNTMEYEQPITGDFTARAFLEPPEAWQRFTALLERRGKARIRVSAVLQHEGRRVGALAGEFVALQGAPGPDIP